MVNRNNPLFKQLENERFEHALSYVQREAVGIKKLNSTELGHLNQMLTANDEPWREGAATIKIPTGHTHEFKLISSPLARARDIAGQAEDLAANQKLAEGVFHIYSHLVKEHLFQDANRRTAALGALWLTLAHSGELDAHELLSIPVGNLRDPSDSEALRAKIKALFS